MIQARESANEKKLQVVFSHIIFTSALICRAYRRPKGSVHSHVMSRFQMPEPVTRYGFYFFSQDPDLIMNMNRHLIQT